MSVHASTKTISEAKLVVYLFLVAGPTWNLPVSGSRASRQHFARRPRAAAKVSSPTSRTLTRRGRRRTTLDTPKSKSNARRTWLHAVHTAHDAEVKPGRLSRWKQPRFVPLDRTRWLTPDKDPQRGRTAVARLPHAAFPAIHSFAVTSTVDVEVQRVTSWIYQKISPFHDTSTLRYKTTTPFRLVLHR